MRASRKPSPWLVAGGAFALMLPLVAALAAGCGREGNAPPAAPAAAFPTIRPVSLAEREQFAGSTACGRCHAEQAQQLGSRHMRTMEMVDHAKEASRFKRPSETFDHVTFLQYLTAVENGRCVLTAAGGERAAKVSPEVSFGSGNRGVTYLGTYEGKPVELRVSYYAQEKRWEFTPSQQAGTRVTIPVGRVVDASTEEGCYRCHSTALVKEGGRLRPEVSLLGIGCESCHGPGKRHIEAVERGEPDLKMLRLGDHQARISTELCGQCHRAPAAADPHDPTTAKQLPRFQGLALTQSACFIKSEGKLSCVTCHDPHANADQVTRVEYNSRCVSCHMPAHAQQIACKREPAGDCESCHMPAQTVDIPTRPKFRTHWIKVWDQPESARR
jgi:hypothetical protein